MLQISTKKNLFAFSFYFSVYCEGFTRRIVFVLSNHFSNEPSNINRFLIGNASKTDESQIPKRSPKTQQSVATYQNFFFLLKKTSKLWIYMLMSYRRFDKYKSQSLFVLGQKIAFKIIVLTMIIKLRLYVIFCLPNLDPTKFNKLWTSWL